MYWMKSHDGTLDNIAMFLCWKSQIGKLGSLPDPFEEKLKEEPGSLSCKIYFNLSHTLYLHSTSSCSHTADLVIQSKLFKLIQNIYIHIFASDSQNATNQPDSTEANKSGKMWNSPHISFN